MSFMVGNLRFASTLMRSIKQRGNVVLFTPAMLPTGCVHLLQDGLGTIAARLGIDYARALVGFTFRADRATPDLVGRGGTKTVGVLTLPHLLQLGIVVCKEFEAILLEAWQQTRMHAIDSEVRVACLICNDHDTIANQKTTKTTKNKKNKKN